MSDSNFEDRYGQDACPRCGGREVIPDARVATAGPVSVVGHGRPNAWLFKKRKRSEVRASVCTQCGHIDLYAKDPETLREAYEARDTPA